jgi:uncharacterized protein (TIGR02001 family)
VSYEASKQQVAAVVIVAAGLWSWARGWQCAGQEQKPEHEVSYNAALTSDYRYRGLSQSRLDPALQGGADYVHNPTGFYAGTWLSTIKWTKDLGGDGNVEWDLYGGKRGNLTPDISYDVGGLYYFYPSNGLGPNANTFELYGQLGYGPAYVKYSHSLTNLFGTADSKGSGYLDVGANVDVGSGLVLNLHVGRQRSAPQRRVFLYRLQDRRDQGPGRLLGVAGLDQGRIPKLPEPVRRKPRQVGGPAVRFKNFLKRQCA